MHVGQASSMSLASIFRKSGDRMEACLRQRSDAVVTTVPDAFGFGAQFRDETLCNESAIRASPAHGKVVTAEVILRGERFGRYTFPVIFIHIIAQHGFAKPARAAVNEHDKLLLFDAELFELDGIEDLLDCLQFGEVVPTADRAECRVELCGFEIVFSEEVAHKFLPRVFEVEAQRGPSVKLHFAAEQVDFEQRHAATDAAADDCRVNYTLGHECSSNRCPS